MKVVVIGSKGMAGHLIRQVLIEEGEYEVVDIARGPDFFTPVFQLDVTNFNSLADLLIAQKPAFVINCIGVLNNDAEANPDKAILLNSYFPHFLAKICTSINAKLIHISTDCVFNGKRGGYKETDIKDGFGFYAQSKALGEVTYDEHLTIRTSIVGPELKMHGIGLLHWFLNQDEILEGYVNAFWSGVTTLQLAKSIVFILENNVMGLYHLTNNEKISKYDLLQLFKKASKREKLIITPDPSYFIDKSFINTREDIKIDIPRYEIMINEMFDFIKKNKTSYIHYPRIS